MSDLSPFLQRLREAVLLSSVIGQYITIKRHGHEYQACCPFHNEKTPSFTINDQKGFYHCFGCGAHGDALRFMTDYHHLPFLEAVTQLANIAGLPMPRLEKSSHKIGEHDTPQTNIRSERDLNYAIMDDACLFFEQTLQKNTDALSYLKERGCDTAIISRFRIGFGSHELISFLEKKGYSHTLMENAGLIIKQDEGKGRPLARFRNRIMIPIMDPRHRVIAFGGRLFAQSDKNDGHLAKYVNSPQTLLFNKSQVLFGASTMNRPSKDNPLVVVEGYFDVIMAQKNGINAVAPLGTALTQEHLQRLWKYSFEPILCFDGDAAGKKAMHRAIFHAMSHLKPGYTLRCAILPHGEDPDSLLRMPTTGIHQFHQCLEHAKPLFEVFCDAYAEAIAHGAPEIKAMRKKEFSRLVDTIQDEDVKSFYKQEFFETTQSLSFKNTHFQNLKGPRKGHFLKHPHDTQKLARLTPLKNDGVDIMMQKILLVTLLNHPTLIAQMIEYIVQVHFSINGAEGLVQEMINYAMDREDFTEESTHPFSWISPLARSLIHDQSTSIAPFSSHTSSDEDAEIGFMDIWHRYTLKKSLEHDLSIHQTQLKKAWDPVTWQALQQTHKDLQSFLATKE